MVESVNDGEKILDMFYGSGPFPIVIAKNKDVDIAAVDINEAAFIYFK